MKTTINEKACIKHKLTLQEFLIALSIRAGNLTEALQNLLAREVIVKRGEEYFLTQHWSEVVDEVLSDSANDEEEFSEERLLALTQKVQECFPQAKMRDVYGLETPFYFRCNKTEIKNKLKKFFMVYGNVPDEDIIDATKRYVASYAPKGYRGMRLAKYFIIKDDRKLMADEEVHVEQVSDLATFLENKESEEVVAINNGDWLVNSRN